MNAIRRYQPPSSAQLLRHVLARPELVAAVRKLPGDVLAALIDRVGLEDAGEIVALASAEQLAQAFEHDLWRAEQAGGDEDFQPERFGLWLEVLSEAGDEFLAQRLAALPRDLLLLALHRTLLVLDIDALAVKMAELGEDAEWTEKALESGHYEEWEEFRLIVRRPEHWDVLWAALLGLDRDHHELLRDLIERCAALDTEFINGNGGLYEVLSSEEMLENDLGAARADRRAAAGHVSPADARAFLTLAQRNDPAVEARGLAQEQAEERDAITRAYFRELAVPAQIAGAPRAAPPRAVQRLTQLVAEAGLQASSQALAVPTLPPAKRRSPKGSALRHTPGAQRDPSLFERALAELQEHEPLVASQRLEELAYLANVWIAGGSHEGRRPRPVEALEHALAICSAGLTRALANEPHERAAHVLARTPADLLFRRGYALQALSPPGVEP
jgi:Family of unknown function (DUF6178)